MGAIMWRVRFWVAAGVLGVGAIVLPVAQSQPAGKGKVSAKLEPVGETELLMEGLVNQNVRALGRVLSNQPRDAEAWRFTRAQALLSAEAGNLLLIGPPRTAGGEEAWMGLA